MSKSSQPAWGMGSSSRTGFNNRKDRDFKGISPASYDATKVDLKKKDPCYSFGARTNQENTKLNVPGSGSYEIKSKMVESQGKTFGSKTAIINEKPGLIGPGPQGYNYDKPIKNNFRFSMGSKLQDISTNKQAYKPAPTAYNPRDQQSVKTMVFGTGSRSDLAGSKEKKYKPGPGQYLPDANALKDAAPKFGFGTSNRPEIADKKRVSPGPGYYTQQNFTGKEGQSKTMGAITKYTPHVKEQAFKPGPGNYNPVLSKTMRSDPAFKMGSEIRKDLAFEKQQKFRTSPGQYNPSDKFTKTAPASWGFGSDKRKGQVQRDQYHSPAPNSYTLQTKIDEGPKIGMHHRTNTVDQDKKNNFPGPGQYDLQNKKNLKQSNAPQYKMGTGSRSELGGGKDTKFKPGPGAYEGTADLKKTAPKFGFGSSQRPDQVNRKSPSPGPAVYKIPSSMVETQGKSMAAKLVDPFVDKKRKLVPGPGNYEPKGEVTKKTAPQYKMGTETRDKKAKDNFPSSDTYNPKDTFTKTASSAFGFGTENRNVFKDEKRVKAIPGPGNYEIKSAAFQTEKPRFHIGQKLNDLSKMATPAPSAYSPDAKPSQKKEPSFSMGIKLKNEIAKKDNVPGPGQYTNKAEALKKSPPKFGFGTSSREQIPSKTVTPGPGTYKINTTVSDVAAYTGAQRDEFKYV